MLIREFQEQLIEALQKKLGEYYKINENNYVLIVEKKDSLIKSVFYVEEYFMLYKKINNLKPILLDITEKIAFEETMQKKIDTQINLNLTNYEKIKDSIFFRLIKTQTNTKLLQHVPSVPFLDLSIVFYIEIQSSIGSATILIKNDLASILKISKAQLYKDALNNLQTFKPCRIKNLSDVVFETETETVPSEISDFLVMTNAYNKYGASCVLYPDALKRIAEKLKKDIFIIPSSIHEVLVTVNQNIKVQDLAKMLHEVNIEELAPEEQLSFHIYKYSIKDDSISIAY